MRHTAVVKAPVTGVNDAEGPDPDPSQGFCGVERRAACECGHTQGLCQ